MKRIMGAVFSVALAGSLILSNVSFAMDSTALTPVGTEKTYTAANSLPITVKVVGPVQAQVDLQIICLFKHKLSGDTYLESLDILDHKLGGSIRALRNRGEFIGNVGETILITPPPNSIPAKQLLIIGLGEESQVNTDVMRETGVVAMRSAQQLGAVNVAYAPTMRDQSNSSLPTGDVAKAVMIGIIAAYDTQKRLEKENLSTPYSVNQWIFEAGQKYYADVATSVQHAVDLADYAVLMRPRIPYTATETK